jgi:hypothetical protein
MRFAMPAFRTQAGADSAPRKGTAQATSTLSGLTLPLSAAWPHSGTFSSVHRVFLLVCSAHSAATASTAAGATGHDKGVALQVAAKPGLNDLAQVAGDERDYPYANRGDHLMERPGDRAANQSTDAKFHQAMRLLDRQVIGLNFLRFTDDSSRLDLDDVNPPCNVEDRRDSMVPVCKCRFQERNAAGSDSGDGLRASRQRTSRTRYGMKGIPTEPECHRIRSKEDAVEGVQAFLGKRAPKWKKR